MPLQILRMCCELNANAKHGCLERAKFKLIVVCDPVRLTAVYSAIEAS